MKRKSASGSRTTGSLRKGRGWKSCGPSSCMDPSQGSLGETDGIIIHILSVLFISSTVSCFSSSCWEKWRDPYSWAGQITLSPLGDAAAFNIQYVCPYVLVCVFESVCLSSIKGFPVEMIINLNMHTELTIKRLQWILSFKSCQEPGFISFPTSDLDQSQASVGIHEVLA